MWSLYRGGEKVGMCFLSETFKMFVLQILQRRIVAGRSCHGGLGWLEKKKKSE